MDKFSYWKFFCNNTFAEDDKLQFFADGSFTISTANKEVLLYSHKTEFVKRYENAFVLDNGSICERKEDSIMVHHSNSLYTIPCPSGAKVYQSTNAIGVADGKTSELLFVFVDAKPFRHFSVEKGCTAFSASVDGKFALKNKGGVVNLFDQNGLPISFNADLCGVSFLANGAYIVNFFTKGSALYNKKNELVLSSERCFGILECGDVVKYENALIADTEGCFLDEYRQQRAVYGNLSIYPYHVCNEKGEKRFWPGGKMMHFKFVHMGLVLYYYHAGHFYFVPQGMYNTCDLSNGHDELSQRYYRRIAELQF